MGPGCDEVRPGSLLDTSEFALSTQPPTSSNRCSTISVAKNHPAAAARRSKKPPPPRRESRGRSAKTNASKNITLLSGRKQNPTGTRLPSRLAPLRDLTPPPPIAPPVSDALDNSLYTDDALDNSFDAVDTGREGGLVDLSIVESVAAAAVGGGEGLSVNSASDDSSDVKESDESAPLFGVEVLNGSPTFSLENDQMADSPTDNEVSKYSFYSRLNHYMEGHKISESNRDAVKLCLLSEAGAFVRKMDPMKKDIKDRAFLLSISRLLMKLRMISSWTKH